MADCSNPISLIQVLIYSPKVSEKCEFLLNSYTQVPQFDISSYILIFFLTCSLELVFYFWILKRHSYFKRVIALFFANLTTHPVIYFFLSWLFSLKPLEYKYYLLTAEIFAPIVEAGFLSVFFKINLFKSLKVMFLANLFSWILGVYLLG